MELTFVTVEKIAEMFFIMVLGAGAFRLGITDSRTNKQMSGLLLKIVTPVMLYMTYQIDFDLERLRGLAITLGLSLASFGLALGMVRFLIPARNGDGGVIEQLVVVYSNCGFIGIPLINGILGAEGVFYLTAYLTAFHMVFWPHGMTLMCGTVDRRAMMRNFLQPAVIAIGLGIACFLLRIRVPEVLGEPMSMVGSMNTPLAMLIAGGQLAESGIARALKKPRIYWISFLKLVLVPAVSILLLSLVPVKSIYIMTVLIATACPTSTMAAMLALQHNKDSSYASELFTITTVLSLGTIPVMVMLAGWVLAAV